MLGVLITTELPDLNDLKLALDQLVQTYADWWLALDAKEQPHYLLPVACVHSQAAMDRIAQSPDCIDKGSPSLLLQWQRLPHCPQGIKKIADKALLTAAGHLLQANEKTAKPALKRSTYDAGINRFIKDGEVCDSVGSLLDLELLLRAYEINDQETFLHVADRYGEAWADALLDTDAVPQHLPATIKREDSAIAPIIDEKILARAWIEKGATDLFLALYQHTSTPIYLIAARKLLDIAASDLRAQDCAYAVRAIHSYYQHFDDGYFDEYVRIAAARNPLQSAEAIQLKITQAQLEVQLQRTGQTLAHPTLQIFYGQITRRQESIHLAMQLTTAVLNSTLAADKLDKQDFIRWLSASSAAGHGWLEDVILLSSDNNKTA
jgi:hypothetical protein